MIRRDLEFEKDVIFYEEREITTEPCKTINFLFDLKSDFRIFEYNAKKYLLCFMKFFDVEIKEFLRSNYLNIRECYKYYAGIIPSNGVFCICKTLFNEIINFITPSIIDSNLTITAIDLEFITTISGIKPWKMNPHRDLVRFQFMEIFVRLGIHKYFKNKIWKTKFEAIQKFFNEDLGNFFWKFRSYEWRENEYYCEEVEYIIKEYMGQLDELFAMYSGRYTMPSKPKFVSLEEFCIMIDSSGVLSLNITK